MKASITTAFLIAIALFMGTGLLSAAEISLSGTDPTTNLPTNPPVFAFSILADGTFMSEYINTSGYTFLNLIITGPADGVTGVGCAPGNVFTGCSASLTNGILNFQFFGGPGIATNQPFFLTATGFTPGDVINGTSTMSTITGTPEPATIGLALASLSLCGLAARRR